MRCLLCEDIMKEYETGDLGDRYESADLDSVRKIHQERYVHHFQVSLALDNQLEFDSGLLKPPESDAYGSIELVGDGQKESIEFGPMKAQGEIYCIADGSIPAGYCFDVKNGYVVKHPAIMDADLKARGLPESMSAENPPENMRYKYNPFGTWLGVDKPKCSHMCCVKELVPVIDCLMCRQMIHCKCAAAMLTKHNAVHPEEDHQGIHFEHWEHGVCSKKCLTRAMD